MGDAKGMMPRHVQIGMQLRIMDECRYAAGTDIAKRLANEALPSFREEVRTMNGIARNEPALIKWLAECPGVKITRIDKDVVTFSHDGNMPVNVPAGIETNMAEAPF